MRFTPALLATVAAVPALAAPQPCGPLELIYARATTEPPGAISATASIEAFDTAAAKVWSKGFGAAGASLFSNVTALIPGATGWPVHYPADWKGCVSEDKGISDLLARIAGRSKECPATKFVLGGHSQGGVVTVRAIPQIPKDLLAKVVAVTMFGSPQCPAEVKGRCKSYCNTGDLICTGTGGATAAGRCKAPATKRTPVPDLAIRAPTANEVATFENLKREVAVTSAADCAKADVEAEHGHAVPGVTGTAAHMAYNSDGYYIKSAACYIVKQLAAAKV